MSELLSPALMGLATITLIALSGWLASLARHDASLADRLWPLFFAAPAWIYALDLSSTSLRAKLMLVLVSLWAVRLGAHITWRNWGHGEDKRYVAMRERGGSSFAWRSVYRVFGLQGLLAWIIGAPLLFAAYSTAAPGLLDALAVALILTGLAFEAIADYQLARFLKDPSHHGKVMDRGLWRYSRHPNYFGEACLWWGFGILGFSVGGVWSLLPPLLLTFLLLKVSGVAMLEKDIAERRPAYRDYILRTNAFMPGPTRESGT